MIILKEDFYGRETLIVAKELLGKYLIHNIDGKLVGGKIVETEGYLGVTDKAAHVYGGKKLLELCLCIKNQEMLIFIAFMECIIV